MLAKNGLEVEPEDVGLDDGHVRQARIAAAAPRASRSISTATTAAARSARARVSAPRPGPISRKTSSGPRFDGVDDLANPRGLEEVLAETLPRADHRASPRPASISLQSPRSLPRSGRSSDPSSWMSVSPMHWTISSSVSHSSSIGPLIETDAVGERVAVAGRTLGQRRALIQPEQRVIGADLQLLEHVVRTAHPRRRWQGSGARRGTFGESSRPRGRRGARIFFAAFDCLPVRPMTTR